MPLTLDAEVVADHGARGLGLRFRRVNAEQRAALERLVAALPLLEELGDADGGGALVVSSVRSQNAIMSASGGHFTRFTAVARPLLGVAQHPHRPQPL